MVIICYFSDYFMSPSSLSSLFIVGTIITQVGHAFVLETKYSKDFQARFIDQAGNKKFPGVSFNVHRSPMLNHPSNVFTT